MLHLQEGINKWDSHYSILNKTNTIFSSLNNIGQLTFFEYIAFQIRTQKLCDLDGKDRIASVIKKFFWLTQLQYNRLVKLVNKWVELQDDFLSASWIDNQIAQDIENKDLLWLKYYMIDQWAIEKMQDQINRDLLEKSILDTKKTTWYHSKQWWMKVVPSFIDFVNNEVNNLLEKHKLGLSIWNQDNQIQPLTQHNFDDGKIRFIEPDMLKRMEYLIRESWSDFIRVYWYLSYQELENIIQRYIDNKRK